jgi:hypothetical protein
MAKVRLAGALIRVVINGHAAFFAFFHILTKLMII